MVNQFFENDLIDTPGIIFFWRQCNDAFHFVTVFEERHGHCVPRAEEPDPPNIHCMERIGNCREDIQTRDSRGIGNRFIRQVHRVACNQKKICPSHRETFCGICHDLIYCGPVVFDLKIDDFLKIHATQENLSRGFTADPVIYLLVDQLVVSLRGRPAESTDDSYGLQIWFPPQKVDQFDDWTSAAANPLIGGMYLFFFEKISAFS